MKDLIFGNHVGIVINTADPDQRNRIQVWVPHLSTTVYDTLNKEGKDLVINQGSLKDIEKIKDRLISHLPWAESAVPIFGGNGSTFTNPENLQTTATHRPIGNENTNNPRNQVETQGNKAAENPQKDVSSTGTPARGDHNDAKAIASDFPEYYKYAYEGETVADYKLRLYGTAIMAVESGTAGVLDKKTSKPNKDGADYGYFQMNNATDKNNFLRDSKLPQEQKQFVADNLWASNTNVPASDAMRAWTMYVKSSPTYGAKGGFVDTITNTPIENFSDYGKMTSISESVLTGGDGSSLWSTPGSRQLKNPKISSDTLRDQNARFAGILSQNSYLIDKSEDVKKLMEKTSPSSGAGTVNVAGSASPDILPNLDPTINRGPKGSGEFTEPGGMLSTPLPGSMVWVFFHGGDINRPVYFAGVAEPNLTGRTGNTNVAVTPGGPSNQFSLNKQEPIKLNLAPQGSVLLTDAKGNAVKDVNGNDVYVDSADINKLTSAADKVTCEKSGGVCYRGVKGILWNAGLIEKKETLSGGVARMAEADLLRENNNPNSPTNWTKLSTSINPEDAPVGSVIVYSNGQEPGHVEVKVSNKQYASDFVNDRPLTLSGNRKLQAILVPTPKQTTS